MVEGFLNSENVDLEKNVSSCVRNRRRLDRDVGG